MGSTDFNFKNFGTDPPPELGSAGGRLPDNFPLARMHSIYSLTFDEFQSTVGGIGKDFGSMNMDELLKNIWSAEENQNGSTIGGGGQDHGGGGGFLPRQGSLSLPRTLSLKTVDQVWRDLSKDSSGGNISTVPHREPTLGETTLEEFLFRAGVVREEAPIVSNPNNGNGSLGDLSLTRPVNNSGLGFGYPQLLPKQPTLLGYGAPTGIPSGNQFSSPGINVGINNNSMVQNATLQGGGLGMGLGVDLGKQGPNPGPTDPFGLGANKSSSDGGISKSNGDTSSVSPVPYVFNNGGGLRGGRRSGAALEKVVERRQRRMIKNRESAARSRARKQAYTTELEGEIAKLKEENEELRKIQEKMVEMQKNQVLEMMNQQNRSPKRRCLRRTQTGPW